MRTATASAFLFEDYWESPAQGELANVVRESERKARAAVRDLRPLAPPLDVLDPDVATIVADTWRVPCEAMFEFLASRHPGELLKLIRSPRLHSTDLTFAAEIAGRVHDAGAVRTVLVELLGHPDAIVREGAIYGLAHHLDDATRGKLREIATTDRSVAVRTAAVDVSSET